MEGIIRIIRINSRKLNFSLLPTKIYKIMMEIFQKIEITYHELLYTILDDSLKQSHILEKYNRRKFHIKYHLNRMIISNAMSILHSLFRKYKSLADDSKNVSKGKELLI